MRSVQNGVVFIRAKLSSQRRMVLPFPGVFEFLLPEAAVDKIDLTGDWCVKSPPDLLGSLCAPVTTGIHKTARDRTVLFVSSSEFARKNENLWEIGIGRRFLWKARFPSDGVLHILDLRKQQRSTLTNVQTRFEGITAAHTLGPGCSHNANDPQWCSSRGTENLP